MIDTVALTAELTRDEGLRLKAYVDTVGKMTIGVGRNLTDKGISLDEAHVLLTNDMTAALDDCTGAFPWFAALDDARQRVLVNLCFNLGLPRLMGFRRMLIAMEYTRFNAAADELLDSDAARALPDRYGRLAQMLRTGRAA
jgi:lysozyme